MGISKGATLMELMISLAVISIIVTSVGPTVQDILISNRIVAEVNELSSVVQFARHNAIDEQTDTVFCPSSNFSDCSNDWNLPKMVFADVDGNGARGSTETMLAGTGTIISTHLLTGPAGNISFSGNGSVASPATLLLCHEDGDEKYARALIISLQGRVKLSSDSNNDGIHENNSGTALTCT